MPKPDDFTILIERPEVDFLIPVSFPGSRDDCLNDKFRSDFVATVHNAQHLKIGYLKLASDALENSTAPALPLRAAIQERPLFALNCPPSFPIAPCHPNGLGFQEYRLAQSRHRFAVRLKDCCSFELNLFW